MGMVRQFQDPAALLTGKGPQYTLNWGMVGLIDDMDAVISVPCAFRESNLDSSVSQPGGLTKVPGAHLSL
jgi:hypothetical protein